MILGRTLQILGLLLVLPLIILLLGVLLLIILLELVPLTIPQVIFLPTQLGRHFHPLMVLVVVGAFILLQLEVTSSLVFSSFSISTYLDKI
jgi:hypothetical protein